MSYRVLFVCLGNICRSPAAEAVFLHKLEQRGLRENFLVDSAGTGGWHVGKSADSRMRSAAEQRGVIINSIARQFRISDFKEFDIILTMDDDNLRTLMSFSQKSKLSINKDIIYPIMSFSTNSDLKEVPDPYYGSGDGFEKVLDLLEDACDGLLEKIITNL